MIPDSQKNWQKIDICSVWSLKPFKSDIKNLAISKNTKLTVLINKAKIEGKKHYCRIHRCITGILVISVFCQGRDFATFSLKNYKCRIQNRLGAPLSLTGSLFVLLTALKQFIYLKWPLNIINHVSHSYLSLSLWIKRDWLFLCFCKRRSPYFP